MLNRDGEVHACGLCRRTDHDANNRALPVDALTEGPEVILWMTDREDVLANVGHPRSPSRQRTGLGSLDERFFGTTLGQRIGRSPLTPCLQEVDRAIAAHGI